MFYEKQHCCCCVPLAEGVMLVGIYGTSFHVGLLSIQLAYNQATLIPSPIVEKHGTTSRYRNSISNYGPHFNPIPYNYHLTDDDLYNFDASKDYTSRELVDKDLVDAVYPILLFAHVLGIVVNLLLVYGVWRDKRHLMVPWLLVQGLLGLLLAGLALYYLIIFPDKADCMPYAGTSHQEKAVNNQNYPYQVQTIDQNNSSIDAASGCSILLWYCVVMVLALFILLYYFYVVCDFVSQVYFYRDDEVSYEENAIASHEAGQHNNAEFQTDEGLPDIRPAPSIEERKSPNKKSSIISVGSTAKLSIASSTSKLKSANKGRKSVHVIEIVEREPDPLYSEFEDVSQLRSGDLPSPTREPEISVFDSIVSVHDEEQSSSPRIEKTHTSISSSRRDVKPFSHVSQRKNVSFVDDAKSISSTENR